MASVDWLRRVFKHVSHRSCVKVTQIPQCLNLGRRVEVDTPIGEVFASKITLGRRIDAGADPFLTASRDLLAVERELSGASVRQEAQPNLRRRRGNHE